MLVNVSKLGGGGAGGGLVGEILGGGFSVSTVKIEANCAKYIKMECESVMLICHTIYKIREKNKHAPTQTCAHKRG